MQVGGSASRAHPLAAAARRVWPRACSSSCRDAIAPGEPRPTPMGGSGTTRCRGAYGYKIGSPLEVLQRTKTSTSQLMPQAHRVASLLKRWLLGTHQGAVRAWRTSTITWTSSPSGSIVGQIGSRANCSFGWCSRPSPSTPQFPTRGSLAVRRPLAPPCAAPSPAWWAGRGRERARTGAATRQAKRLAQALRREVETAGTRWLRPAAASVSAVYRSARSARKGRCRVAASRRLEPPDPAAFVISRSAAVGLQGASRSRRRGRAGQSRVRLERARDLGLRAIRPWRWARATARSPDGRAPPRRDQERRGSGHGVRVAGVGPERSRPGGARHSPTVPAMGAQSSAIGPGEGRRPVGWAPGQTSA